MLIKNNGERNFYFLYFFPLAFKEFNFPTSFLLCSQLLFLGFLRLLFHNEKNLTYAAGHCELNPVELKKITELILKVADNTFLLLQIVYFYSKATEERDDFH